MRFIGNFQHWIKKEWLTEITQSHGYGRPRDWNPDSSQEEDTYKKAAEAGYNLKSVHFWLFEKSNLSFDIIPPWTTSSNVHWWFTKMYPGQFTPMHSDPHTHENKCLRYWVPMQNYETGHIFIYKDELIKNYRAGDVFVYDDSQDIHGAANIGYSIRLVLQVTEYL